MSYGRGHLAQRASLVEPTTLPEPISREDSGRVAELAVRRSRLRDLGVTDEDGRGLLPEYVLDLPAFEVVPQAVKDGWTRGSSGRVLNARGKCESVASDTPRLSYDGDEPGLLVEAASRTNHVRYSSDFDSSNWSQTRVKTTYSVPNYIEYGTPLGVAGDGTSFANIRQEDAGTFSGNEETASIIVERASSDLWRFQLANSSKSVNVFGIDYDWTTDSTSQVFGNTLLGVDTRKLTINGKDGLQLIVRYNGSNSENISGDEREVVFAPDENDSERSTIIHHVQIEEAPNASSPIVTGGSPTTRSADAYNLSVTDFFNRQEGSFLIDITRRDFGGGGNMYPFTQDGGTKPGLVMQGKSFKVWDPSGNETNSVGSINGFEKNSVAFSFTQDQMRISVGGQSASSSHDGTFLDSDGFIFGGWVNNTIASFDKIVYLPRALPESTLNQITR